MNQLNKCSIKKYDPERVLQALNYRVCSVKQSLVTFNDNHGEDNQVEEDIQVVEDIQAEEDNWAEEDIQAEDQVEDIQAEEDIRAEEDN